MKQGGSACALFFLCACLFACHSEIAAKHGATEELQSARKALAATLEKVEEHCLDFVPELSYSFRTSAGRVTPLGWPT